MPESINSRGCSLSPRPGSTRYVLRVTTAGELFGWCYHSTEHVRIKRLVVDTAADANLNFDYHDAMLVIEAMNQLKLAMAGPDADRRCG